MADQEQVERLKQGRAGWNAWRQERPNIRPDLSNADLSAVDIQYINLGPASIPSATQTRKINDRFPPEQRPTLSIDANRVFADLHDANLTGANLYGADLHDADLRGTHLVRTRLSAANLSGADLDGADLRATDLGDADLNRANLRGANLSYVDEPFNPGYGPWGPGSSTNNLNEQGTTRAVSHLDGANLSWANLSTANLSYAILGDANLSKASLSDANLSNADLSGANLSGANLSGANLSGANLSNADLSGTNLSSVDLSKADLSGANLSKAILVDTNLTGAILTQCAIYGIAVWNVQLEGAKQDNLIITPYSEPVITVDDLEVAQFVYLLLNHKKLRSVLNAVTQRGVLLLGRFGSGGLAVLQAVAARLREEKYLPIIFDFERPRDRNYTETVKTLAGLSRFIIADLSGPSVPQELYATVPHFKIPFVPILEAGRKPFSMAPDLLEYPWVVRPPVIFTSTDELVSLVPSRIIAPAEEKHQARQQLLDELFR